MRQLHPDFTYAHRTRTLTLTLTITLTLTLTRTLTLILTLTLTLTRYALFTDGDIAAFVRERCSYISLYLPHISTISPLYLPRGLRAREVPVAAPLYLPCISTKSPLYLSYISPASPPYLPAGARRGSPSSTP